MGINKEDQLVNDIAVLYHKMLRKNNFFPNYNQELKFYDAIASACMSHYEWEGVIKNIEIAYFKLPLHYRRIIKHDYFYNNYTFWWEEYFTPKQYHSYKKEAISTFISYLKSSNIINKEGEINAPRI